MAARLHVAALVVVLGAACARPGADKAVPFVLETGAPPRPPSAMILGSDDREVVLTGALYTTDWMAGRGVERRRPRLPVPWPRPGAIARAQGATLAFDSPIAPDFIVVQAFAKVAIASREPTGAPIATFECHRFTAPRCAFSVTKSGLRVRGLGREVLAGDYITVFGIWHVPIAQQTDSESEASAGWLFHGDNQRRTGASRR
jgi:hypothetical protein